MGSHFMAPPLPDHPPPGNRISRSLGAEGLSSAAMTQQDFAPYAPGLADAGGQAAQLAEVLALVEEIAGLAPSARGDAALEAAARVSAAYAAAPPVAQRRFDARAAATARWAATGVETLLALQEKSRPSGPAAAALAEALQRALGELSGSL